MEPEGLSRIVPGYFTLMALLLHSRHAVVMRLQGRGASNIVFLAPEMAVLLGVWAVAGLIGRALPRMHFLAES